MIKLIWDYKKVKVEDLKEWSKNPRKITEEDYRKLLDSILQYGFHDVLKIDTDNTILSGHQRRRVLKEIGIKEVTVVFPNRKLTEKEKEIVALSSNRHRGTFDFDMLGNLFELDTLLDVGFTPIELGMKERLPEFGTKHVEFDVDVSGPKVCPHCGKEI